MLKKYLNTKVPAACRKRQVTGTFFFFQLISKVYYLYGQHFLFNLVLMMDPAIHKVSVMGVIIVFNRTITKLNNSIGNIYF